MTHITETTFGHAVVHWFEDTFGPDAVQTQVYQPEPYWFVDLVVDVGFARLFVELENDARSVRSGVAQALGYAGADIRFGVPMVVTPKGHLDGEKIRRLRQSSTVLIREFDEQTNTWV